MSDKNYKYEGPMSGVSLPDGREVMLHSGGEVTLPEDNGYVKTLVAMGRLKEAAPVNQTAKKTKDPNQTEVKNVS